MPITVTIPRPPVTILVLRGDGIKGVGYVGALQVLNEKKVIPNLTTVAGSSAGAITAMLIALGYSQQEIEEELRTLDFSRFMDHPNTFLNRVTGGVFSGLKGLLGYKHGFYQGEILRQWLEEKVEAKLGKKNATFQDLQNAIKTNQEEQNLKKKNQFKELIVTGTNLQTEKTDIFSAATTPDLPIAHAVRISSSIPAFFETVYINKKTGQVEHDMTAEKAKDPNYVPYVDGGLLDNFPIEYLSDERYASLYEINNGINPSVLGLRIDSSFETNAIWNKTSKKSQEWDLWRWLQAVISSPMEDTHKLDKYGFQIISSNDLNISGTDFALSKEGKERLIQKAKEATAAYYDNYIEGSAYEILTFKTKEELEYHYNAAKNELTYLEGLKSFRSLKPDEERRARYLNEILIPAYNKTLDTLVDSEKEAFSGDLAPLGKEQSFVPETPKAAPVSLKQLPTFFQPLQAKAVPLVELERSEVVSAAPAA
ncbi:patatin-like phospholipase family protein [Legionella donaldsonii]|uniref:patatin-like phospholipase family protein n=1 Tax=Legionella donaldsonii TaxID=45060 RepID=UPI00399CF7E5